MESLLGEVDHLRMVIRALGDQSWLSSLLTCVGVLLILALANALYNVFFHPVAKFPGPMHAGATGLVYHLVVMSGNTLPWLRDLHARYGEVVRVAPRTLSYISPQAWKDIYGHRSSGKKSNPKDPNLTPARDFKGVSSVFSEPDDSEHGRIRRIFSNAFSDKALRAQQPLFTRYTNQLVDNIRRDIATDPNQAFDAVKLYNFTTFDIMGDLTFGEPLGLLENSSYTAWVRNVFKGLKMVAIFQFIFDYPLLAWLFRKLAPPAIRKAGETHYQHSAERVDRRLKLERDQPDIWNLVLRQPEGRRLTVDQMHANADLFMLAGTETTATLLSGLTYYLLKNPEKMKKLVDEIRSSFKSEDELTVDSLPKLKYMAACFEEGFRCYPPVPTEPFRVTPEDGNAICGEWVPGNTRVFIAQYPAYMSPVNFKDPASFVPERWLPGTGYDDDRREVLQPFSTGPRNCLGKNLAYHEMRLILSKVLWNFDLELCTQSDKWTDQKSFILWEKPPLMVKMKSVKRD
ncbi:cytochrome P450 [Diaporthe sp. PMI_573]|nr:cytochrome P450 [Diaporthaceae sp. PMI_573]